MKTLIRRGHIITAENEFIADILIDGETVAAIGRDLQAEAEQVIDAAGKFVFPGGIDQHTHFDALCNVGNADTAPYETTKAVCVGGTTTIIDYAPQDPGRGLLDSIHYRVEHRAKGKVCVDYALHALITEITPEMFQEIGKLPDCGVASIKAFMAYKGSPLHVDDGTLLRVMQEAKKAGVTTFVHAENAEIIDRLQHEAVAAGHIAPKYHAETRPPFVEVEATKRAVYLAEVTGAPTFIVHISTEGAASCVGEARARGLRVFGETCTQYLTTTKDKLAHPDYNEAAKYICSPALRDEQDIRHMWEAVNNGTLSAVVSDHCGIDLTMKQAGRGNFADCPNGAPGAADRIPMLWTKGVAAGRMSRQRFVEVCSTLPAKINGLYPRKGTIAVGSDADIVVYDPDYRGTIRLEDNPNGIDYNIYEGTELSGRPEIVFLRGKIVARDGRFVGELGQGRFLASEAGGYCFQS